MCVIYDILDLLDNFKNILSIFEKLTLFFFKLTYE